MLKGLEFKSLGFEGLPVRVLLLSALKTSPTFTFFQDREANIRSRRAACLEFRKLGIWDLCG